MEKDFAIYDAKLAGLLMIKRCRLVTARPDRQDVRKMVFFFDNTEHFKQIYKELRLNKDKLMELINDFE